MTTPRVPELTICVAEQPRQRRQHEANGGLVRGGLAAAQVAQRPGGVTQQGDALRVLDVAEECLYCAWGLNELIAVLGAVASDVAAAPDGLLADIAVGCGK